MILGPVYRFPFGPGWEAAILGLMLVGVCVISWIVWLFATGRVDDESDGGGDRVP